MLSFLAACGTNGEESVENENSVEETEGQSENGKEDQVNVDKGLFNVEITLPASLFEGEDIEKVIADAKAEGVDEVTLNEDGSLTYKMSKAKHKEMMEGLKEDLILSLEDMKSSGEYSSIKDITYNNTFSEFILVVDKTEYENSMDGFGVFSLGITGMIYQLYNGVNPDEYEVTILVKDEETEEIFDQIVYPDDLEDGSE